VTRRGRARAVEIPDGGPGLLRLAADVVETLDIDLRKHLSPGDQQDLDRLLPLLLQSSATAGRDRA